MSEHTFTGQVVSATPTKALFVPNEAIRLRVITRVDYQRTGVSTVPDWQTKVNVYNESGVLQGSRMAFHAIAVWTIQDYADEDVVFELNPAEYSQNYRVELLAKLDVMGADWQFMADQYVPVHIYQSPVEPAPIPGQPNIPGIPDIPPEPLPSPEPGPEPEPGPTIPWKWVLVGLGVILIFMPNEKGKKK